MKKQLIGIGAALALLGGAGLAQATLITIGTATYDDGSGAADYKLIWDDDNNGNSVVWLDYTYDPEPDEFELWPQWNDHQSWAAGLDGQLMYNIDARYNVTWDDAAWRLPSTVDGQYQRGYDGTTTAGYNITTSEMGHLFYTELGNLGFYDPSGQLVPGGGGLVYAGEFENLQLLNYWSATEYTHEPFPPSWRVWFFGMVYGEQGIISQGFWMSGLAIRSGQVNAAAPIPEPATMLLFGTGLAGLAGYIRRQAKKK